MNKNFARTLPALCACLLVLLPLAWWLRHRHDPESLADYNRRAAAWDQNIKFYGKVVDEKGAPLPGVKIIATGTTQQILPDQDLGVSGYAATETDASGLFTIQNLSGYALNIIFMDKEGYAMPYHQQIRFLDGSSLYHYAFTKGDPDCFQPSQSSPEVFQLWKLSPPDPGYQNIISSAARTRVDGFTVNPAAVNFDLRADMKCEEAGDITLRSRKAVAMDPATGQSHDRWTIVLRANRGQVQLADPTDKFLFRAPGDGYQPQIEFSDFLKPNSFGHPAVKFSFFWEDKDRHLVAAVECECAVDHEAPLEVSFHLKGRMNMSGSRNLECTAFLENYAGKHRAELLQVFKK
jgi:hypothetical protein